MAARIAVHGHFYQPPRENPWTSQIDPQPSAAPAHDWNERVHAECYRPNAFARIPARTEDAGEAGEAGDAEAPEEIVNNFEKLSFNVGPTLLDWMESADPETYRRIIEADAASRESLGHGNALAQAYHHTILPLATQRDVRTQVRWGLADFRHRFGREAEGMWLPETAADSAVLSVLIEEGVGFTILAPGQADRWRADDGEWYPVLERPLDTRVPYRFVHPDGSGRAMTLFFYDGAISHQIAFDRAGSSSERFIDLFDSRKPGVDQLVHAATDGETYGHHHVFTDLGLAYALFVEAPAREIEVTNYATFLERFPPRHEVSLVPGASSWSCAHGIGRWKEDCGCSTGGEPGWNQRWRAPLREGLELLREVADEAFDRLGGSLFNDPWAARDRYIEVVVGAGKIDDLITEEAAGPISEESAATMHRLLELQRNAMSMFTSCGWFFNDVAGIETVQVMRYAARTVDLLEELGQPTSEDRLVTVLERAESNDPTKGTAADLYLKIASSPKTPPTTFTDG